MGGAFSHDHEPWDPCRDEVKDYCESVIFVKFYGQTNSMKGSTDEDDHTKAERQTDLGHFMKELDAEIRAAPSPDQLEITDKIKAILFKLAKLRSDENKCESPEDCHKRLLEDMESFVKVYKKRGVLSEELHHERYWGTRQQLLFGKVVSDWLDIRYKKPKDKPPTDPLFGSLMNPTGGRVGPGDTGWFHDTLFDDLGEMAYHSAVHDGFGYLKTNHDTGPGYNYLDLDLLADTNPLAGQVSGIEFWRWTLGEYDPANNLNKFKAV